MDMRAPDAPMLKCTNATVRFGSLVAVDNVSLSVAAGETVGIGGPNGAGKTTFLDLISGLLPLAGGKIAFEGQPISGLAPHLINRLGIARTFQLNAGFDGMSVHDNVLTSVVFGQRVHRTRGPLYTRNDLIHTAELLEEFGLNECAQTLVSDISILARKKLMVATALATDPKLLLMDEPVGGLTPAEVDDYIQVVLGLKKRGITMVFIEHVMRFLTAVADRAVIMHHGSLIYDGPPSGIAHDAQVTEVYLGKSAQAMRGDGQ